MGLAGTQKRLFPEEPKSNAWAQIIMCSHTHVHIHNILINGRLTYSNRSLFHWIHVVITTLPKRPTNTMSQAQAGAHKILLSRCNVTVMKMIITNTCASNTHRLGALITAMGQSRAIIEKQCVILFM